MSTNIQWTDETWNPIRAHRPDAYDRLGNAVGGTGWHCEHVSEGCRFCYAETQNMAQRFDLGTGLEYTRPNRERVSVYLHEETLVKPLHWRKSRLVFVCSMTDLFGEWVTDEMLDRVFAVMALTPHITYQVLTKRPERMRAYLSEMGRHYMAEVDGEYMERWGDAAVALTGDPCAAGGPIEDCGWPLPNVWLGTSVEDQPAADTRIAELLATPAAVRYLSCEPLLGPVDIEAVPGDPPHSGFAITNGFGQPDGEGESRIHWVIVGGESGAKARPCDIAWIRGIVAQCQAAGVPVFVKQLGTVAYSDDVLGNRWREAYTALCASKGISEGLLAKNNYHAGHSFARLRDRHGGDMAEWPEDLRIRTFPGGVA